MGYIFLTDEQKLIIACKSGDKAAYEQLIRMHLELINNTVYTIVRDEKKAKEISVLICIHIWKVRDKIPVYGSLKVYLCNYIHAVIKKAALKTFA
jgi:hypothetical protein